MGLPVESFADVDGVQVSVVLPVTEPTFEPHVELLDVHVAPIVTVRTVFPLDMTAVPPSQRTQALEENQVALPRLTLPRFAAVGDVQLVFVMTVKTFGL